MDTTKLLGAAAAAGAAFAFCGGAAKPEAPTAVPSASVVFYVNGVQVSALPHEVHPRMTLLEFLRENLKLTGTKLSCNQGGCGACTVTLTSWEESAGKWEHRAINACLRPVLSCDGMAITTSEGIGSNETGFHPVQERIAACNGSQGGFCTPGQVMSMYSLLREKGNEALSLIEIEERFDGNICRCTGYRPIMTAAHTFAAEGGRDRTDVANFSTKFAPYVASSEKPPPAGARQASSPSLQVVTADAAWHRVASIAELESTRKAAIAAGKCTALVVGNTKTGPYGPNAAVDTFLDISRIPELNTVSSASDGPSKGITVGAAVSITKLCAHLQTHKNLSASFETLCAHMKRVANWQVRNVGSWAGNLTMAKTLKFASDLSTIFMGAGCTLRALYKGSEVTLSIYDYLWQEHDMDQLLLVSMHIPALADGEIFQTYRTALRQNSAHALLNAAFRVTVTGGTVTAATLVYGLAQDRAIFATAAQAALVGQAVASPRTLSAVLGALEGSVINDLIVESHYKTVYQPEGKEGYRRSLVRSYFYKFFLHLMGDATPAALRSATKVYERGASSGKQVFKTKLPADHPGSRPMPKIEAKEQAAGETLFHDDEGNGDCLHAAFVPCTKAPAKIVSIDASAAFAMPGVVDFVTAEDIPGINSVAFAAPGHEELLVAAGDDGKQAGTSYVGQPIGVIVAKSRREAEAATEAVQVVYATSEPGIYSLEDAIAAKSFYGEVKEKTKGDVAAQFAQAAKAATSVVISGELRIGGQSHFAMEKNICLAIPMDQGRYELHHSTQFPDAARGHIAGVVGTSEEKIQIICRRMGGAFGGKATKCIPIGMAATVCAKKLRR